MEIKKLSLVNFRNFPKLELEFAKINELVRDNGWGKSNIADSIVWVLTGKLMDATSDIESIKPKTNSKALVDVEIIFDNNVTIRKTYQENWVKTRGGSDLELKGHSTTCYYNGLEMTQTAFEGQLFNAFGISQDHYHLLIDPTYFGLKLDWKKRREIINGVVGTITFDEIVRSSATLQNNATLTSKLKVSLDTFGHKIDLVKKGYVQSLNKLKKEEKELEAQITGLSVLQSDLSKEQYEQLLSQDESIRKQIFELEQLNSNGDKIKRLEQDLEYLRSRFKSIQQEQFYGHQPHQSNCPNCNYILNKDEYDKLLAKYETDKATFETKKANNLTQLNADGVRLKQELDVLKAKESGTLVGYTEKVSQLRFELARIKTITDVYVGYQQALVQIQNLTEKLKVVRHEIATTELLTDLLNEYVSGMLKILNQKLELVFGDIKFRLIEDNIKEGSWNEVCDVMDGKVPYDRTNTASQIKLGVKLVDALRKKFKYQTIPLIIDNAEAVVDRSQFDTESQIVCLIAGKGI